MSEPEQAAPPPTSVSDDFFSDDVSDEALLAACQKAESSASSAQPDGEDPTPAPLLRFRSGYLWISDICRQMWCEQQLHYSFEKPTLIRENEAANKGSELHLERELETQDYVNVEVETKEDIFAVKLFNLVKSLEELGSGVKSVNREVPVFGHYDGIFFLGKIDELRMETGGDRKKRTLTLEEFKTRSQPRLPGRAQKETHDLQVMLYKHFIDEIVSADDGDAIAARRADGVCESLGLDKNLSFGCELISHFRDGGGETATNLKELFAKLGTVGKRVPEVTNLAIDYAFQGDGESFAKETVQHDEQWLADKMSTYLPYWRGDRSPKGVEIEEAWKCQNCDFSEDCEWRIKKAAELSKSK